MQTHRQHREEQARLLEENASLKARIAAEAARVAMGVLPGTGLGRPGPKTFAAVGEHEGMGGVLEAWMGKLERWVWGHDALGDGISGTAPPDSNSDRKLHNDCLLDSCSARPLSSLFGKCPSPQLASRVRLGLS